MELNDQQIKEIIAGKHGPNTSALKMKPVVKRAIIEAMASGEIDKSEGLDMLKADYMIFSFLGMMQTQDIDPAKLYIGPELRDWFSKLESNKSILT